MEPEKRRPTFAQQMVTRIITRFEGFTGRYVWHCHILEHEDNEMMDRTMSSLREHKRQAHDFAKIPAIARVDFIALEPAGFAAKVSEQAVPILVSETLAAPFPDPLHERYLRAFLRRANSPV
jgi:hypothetical protein